MTRTTRTTLTAGFAAALVAVGVNGCGDSVDNAPLGASVDASADGRGLENTGQACSAPVDCYPGLEAGSIKGEVQCLDRVTGGYCTHLCQTDADCCATPGECKSGFKQVCSPFESTGQKMCFLSCESADIQAAPDGGALDDTGYCEAYASAEFRCRSSGGGSNNRKVCVPGGTAGSDAGPDAADAAH